MVVESFKRVGDEMWPNHIGIFTIPVMFAVKMNIPLIIWGENPQMEYGGPDLRSVQSRVLNRKWLRRIWRIARESNRGYDRSKRNYYEKS